VKVLSWVIMSNHFHLLVEVPPVDRENMPPGEVFRRLSFIWGSEYLNAARAEYDLCETAEERRAFLNDITYRMGDLRHFMKAVKQRFTLRYNKEHERTGTLWESRYHSVIVEGDVPVEEDEGVDSNSNYEAMSDAARIVAAYIDLNPVRAGLVDDPADYRWSSYGAAVAGDPLAQAGLARIWSRSVEEALAEHRVLVFEEGSEERVPQEGEKSKRVGIPKEKVWEVIRQKGKLPLHQILRVRVRTMSEGGIIGSRDFVRQVYEESKETLGENRRRVSTPMRYGEWGGLHAYRNLRKNLMG
jgi:hypothetical protein